MYSMIDKLTIGIKTFCRPKVISHCLHYFALESKYMGIKIIVADDSSDELKKENQEIINNLKKNDKINIEYINLPFDTGLSAGRNIIVEHCTTKYIMIIDDSRTFNKNTRIFDMVRFLEETDYDLIAGVIPDRRGNNSLYYGIFDKIYDNNGITHIEVKKKEDFIKNSYFKKVYKTNITLNIFIARTSSLAKSKWNNELKVGEHELFFYNYFKNDFKCAVTNEVDFIQAPHYIRVYPRRFRRYRKRAYTNKKHTELEWI